MNRTTSVGWTAALLVAGLLAGCGGGGNGSPAAPEQAEEPAGSDGDAVEQVDDRLRMGDVVGMPVDEAVAQLEELGFVVSTGVVRTTEMEPDLVFRSEPHAGSPLTEGQRITLRVAAEPRQ